MAVDEIAFASVPSLTDTTECGGSISLPDVVGADAFLIELKVIDP